MSSLVSFFPQSNSDKTCSRQQIASEVSQFCPQPLHSAAFCALWNHIILLCTLYMYNVHVQSLSDDNCNEVQCSAQCCNYLPKLKGDWAMLALTDNEKKWNNFGKHKRMTNNKLSSKLFKFKFFCLVYFERHVFKIRETQWSPSSFDSSQPMIRVDDCHTLYLSVTKSTLICTVYFSS